MTLVFLLLGAMVGRRFVLVCSVGSSGFSVSLLGAEGWGVELVDVGVGRDERVVRCSFGSNQLAESPGCG